MPTKLISLIMSSLLVVACSKSSSSATNSAADRDGSTGSAKLRDSINISLGGEPPTLDPDLAEDTTSFRVLHDLFEGLLSFDQSGEPIPGLASSYSVTPDQKTYSFTLRRGIKFSDGSPISAEDVVKSWQRFADPKTASPQNNMLEVIVNGTQVIKGKLPPSALAVSAPNPTTVVVKLAHPSASFVYLVAGSPGFSIVPTKVIAAK